MNTATGHSPEYAPLTPSGASRHARQLFADASAVQRAMQYFRPRIAPMGLLAQLVPAEASVLDVGCGCGLFLGLLARTGRISRGVGIDADARAIDCANLMRRRLPHPERIEFVHAQADAPVRQGTFDVVSLIDLLHHVPPDRRRAVICQAAELVGPGGRLVVKDMAARPLWRATANRLHDLVLARQWIHHVDFDAVKEWLHELGFLQAGHVSVSMWWYAHELVWFEPRQYRLKDPAHRAA